MAKAQRQWKTKAELVKMVNALREQGMTVKEACEKVGVNFTYYFSVKKKLEGEKAEDGRGLPDLSFEEFVKYRKEYEQMVRKDS